ncbi:MAG: 30S ribosomal protein S6 [Alphaproteobacteria bacterium]|nr:30S ribosomal protein S6 [Alphaproteobacteria bacterium]
MAFYENVFIVRQDVSTQQVEDLTTRFAGLIEAGGGKVGLREYWGLRSMAFRIKKSRKGHYVFLCVDAPAAAVQEMERNMRIDEDVIRYLTVRVPAHEEGPSAMMRNRDRRDERGDRDRDRDRGGRGRSYGREDEPPVVAVGREEVIVPTGAV